MDAEPSDAPSLTRGLEDTLAALDATGSQGHGFELGGSTGRKGAKRLTLFDEAGEQHDYYAIRFILEPSRGRADDQAAAAR